MLEYTKIKKISTTNEKKRPKLMSKCGVPVAQVGVASISIPPCDWLIGMWVGHVYCSHVTHVCYRVMAHIALSYTCNAKS